MTSNFMIAVHALVYLNHMKRTLSSEELAANVCTNPVRIRKVMGMLKKAGLVGAKEGQHGGFYMTCEPEKINLKTIAEILKCQMIRPTWFSGDSDMECLVASGMADIMQNICMQLNDSCMEELFGITIADIDKKIFA